MCVLWYFFLFAIAPINQYTVAFSCLFFSSIFLNGLCVVVIILFFRSCFSMNLRALISFISLHVCLWMQYSVCIFYDLATENCFACTDNSLESSYVQQQSIDLWNARVRFKLILIIQWHRIDSTNGIDIDRTFHKKKKRTHIKYTQILCLEEGISAHRITLLNLHNRFALSPECGTVGAWLTCRV